VTHQRDSPMRCARQSRFVATSAGWDPGARVHSVTLALIHTLSTCPEEKHERAYSLPMLSKDERAYSLPMLSPVPFILFVSMPRLPNARLPCASAYRLLEPSDLELQRHMTVSEHSRKLRVDKHPEIWVSGESWKLRISAKVTECALAARLDPRQSKRETCAGSGL